MHQTKPMLLECDFTARRLVWKEAKKQWPHGRRIWPNITVGTILVGIGCIILQGEARGNNDQPGTRSMRSRDKARLLQILVSEASHLIWVIRCERAIHQRNHIPSEN